MSNFASSRLSDSGIFVCVKASGEWFEALFSSVQQTINEAENGSTIYAPAGIFYENVIVNKTVLLIGAIGFSSIIDSRDSGTAVEVTA